MRLSSRSSSGEAVAVSAAVVVLIGAAIAITASPVRDRSVVTLVLLVVAAAAGAVLGVVGFARSERSRHAAVELERDTVEAWFDAPSLAGFPAQELNEMLPGIGRAEVLRLQTAWLLATQGHDAAWLTRHFGVSADVARMLVETAERSPEAARHSVQQSTQQSTQHSVQHLAQHSVHQSAQHSAPRSGSSPRP
jgi:hypothetical protein